MEEEFEESNIDDLFERLKDSDSAQEKADLAESYHDLFNEMSYDFACDKFDDVEYLYTIVEKIEILKGVVSWSLRAHAYSMQMDQAEKNQDIASVISNGHLAIDALYNQLTEGEENKQFIYQNLSHYYYTLSNYLPDKAVEYWEKSLYYSKESILENAMGAKWVMYFTLLYSTSKQESNLLTEHRASEATIFRNWCFSLNQDGLAYTIASQFIRFKMVTEDNDSVNYSFPEKVFILAGKVFV
ncbi:MAG TPA: hypothetical protein VNW06_13090 [Cytophagaceae bacterium]|nr:hypothetical protein [Cytophagaceae bacterium]